VFRGWASFFGWSQYELGYRNTLMSQSFVPRVVAAGLGSVLLWAGTAKLLDMNAFVGVVGEFGLVWDPLLPTVAWCVVVGELVLGVGLWLGRRWASLGAGGLVAVFLCVLGYGILLGLDIECGCFGSGDKSSGLTLKQAAGIDVLLLGACVWLRWSTRPRGAKRPERVVIEKKNGET
tara:strand:+ start:866 stop:1396 length:531 start_codon:yes stop_codon:yes gene_type:complete